MTKLLRTLKDWHETENQNVNVDAYFNVSFFPMSKQEFFK